MQGGDAGSSLVNDSATAANLTLNIAAGPYSYAGALGGSTANQQNFSLAKTGAGTITFAGAATHSGATTVNNGTLNFNAAATLPGSVAVSGSGNLNFNGTAALTGPVSISAGSLGLGANATVKTLTATGGTVTGYKGVGAGSSTGSTLTVSGGTTSVTTASGATVATVDLTAGTGTLNALANPLAVTNSLSLAGGASITGNFTVQGGNVADNAVARTVTVTDGAITLISPATMRIIAVKDAPVPTPWLGTVAAVSQPFTVTGGNVIVVAVQTRGALNAAPATITWGSTTLNRAVIAQTTGETRETSIYYGLNPAPGTNNIAGTFAGATFTAIDAFTLSGVDPATVKYAGIGSNATNQPVQTVMIPGVAANSFGFGLACDNTDTTLGTNNSCTGFSITSPGSTSTSAFWYAGNQPTNNTAVGGTFLQNMPAGDTLITDTVLSTGAVNNALRSNFAAIVFGPAGSAGPGAMASTTLSVAGPTVTVNLASGGAPSVGALAFTPAAAGGTMTLPTPGASITFGGTSFQGPGTYTVHATSTVTPGPLDDGGSAVTLGKAGPGKMVLNAAPAAFGVSSSVALSGASPGTLGIVGSSSLDPLGSGGAEVLLGSTGGVIQFSSTAGAAVFDNPLAFHDSAAVMAGAYDGGAAGLAVTLGGAYGLSVDSAKTVTLGTANSYTLNLAGPISGAGSVSASGVVNFNGSTNLGGNLNVTGGTVTLGPASTVAVAGQINVQGGTLRPAASNRIDDGATLAIGPNALVDMGVYTDTIGTLRMTGGTIMGNSLPVANYDFQAGVVLPPIVSANGLTKTGAGVLTIGGTNSSLVGDINVNSGTLRTDRDSNLGVLANRLRINGTTLQTTQGLTAARGGGYAFASTLDIPRNAYLTAPQSATWDYNSLASMSDANFTVAAADTLTKTGQGSFSIAADQTNFAGTLAIAPDAGTVEVWAGGKLNNVAGIEIGQGSWLAVKQRGNNVWAQPTDGILSDTAPITLRGGNLWLLSPWEQATLEKTGAIQLAPGYSLLQVGYNGNGNASYTLSAAGLTRTIGGTPQTGSSVIFRGAALGSSTASPLKNATLILVPGQAAGFIGGWALANNDGSGNGGINPAMTAGNTDFAWYDASKGVVTGTTAGATRVASVTAAVNDGTANVNMTAAADSITASKWINSLRISGGAWNVAMPSGSPTLTIKSGGLLVADGSTVNIGTSGAASYLTAGSTAGTTPAELFVHTPLGATVNLYSSVVNSGNAGGAPVTLVRDGTGTVKLWAAGSYTGGTFLNGGATTTDVASLAYFGAGAVTLQQGGTLTLGATGATTYNNGGAYGAPAYTVINRANLVLPTTTTGTVATMNSQGDTFSIGAGSQIRGINNPTANPNKGLLSLTRVAGAGSITAGGQIVLAEDAIVAHSDFSNDNNNGKAGYTIANLGATPDLYFGLYNDFNAGSSQRLDIGAGTPWKGVSSAMEGQKRFYQGTLNVNPGTTDFYLQGISTLGGGTVNLYLGNTTTTGMTIAVGGPATAHVLGSVLLDSDRSTFSSDLTFRVEPGATLTLNQAKAMGGSNAAIAATTSPVIAGVGGRVSLGNAAAVNGPLTVEGGGVLFNNNMGALTGTGTITFQPGGIYDINNVNALSGAQTIVRVPGMIYRINAGDNPTIPNLNLNTAASAAGIYELYNNNDNNENYTPTAPTTWQPNVWLDGGVITHDAQARSWYSTRNGYMAIGPAGAAFAGTTAPGWSGYPALRVDEDFDLGANTLTIGSTDSIDGLPKYGPVELRSAGNRATAGSKIVVLGNGAAGAYLRLRYDPNTNQGTRTWVDVIPNQSRLEIQAGATFDTYATIDVIGSIVGGGIIRNSADQVQPMFVGSDGTDAVFSGAFQAANQGLQIIKVGGGNWTLTGDSSAWTNNALAVASGTVTLKDSGKVKFGTLTNQYFGVTNVYQGATLTFDETGSVNGADRLAGQHLQMDGGALVLKGSTTADTTDALAGQLLLRWDSEVIDIQPSAGRTATLSFTNATASTISWGATGLIKGRNLGDGTGAMLKFNAPPAYTGQTATSGANKAIWPALLASPNTDGSSPMFATLDAANGIRPLALTWNGTAVNEYVTALTSGMAGTPNVVLDATAATGLNNTAINSLTLANSSSVGINAGQTLTLDSGGVLVTADAGITGGTLNAGAAGRQYLFHVLNPAVGGTTLTLTSTLATDTDFVKAGGGTVLFNTRQLRNATKWRSTIRGTVVK